MRKTYKILLVIFFILILKCITPEDVQADTFHLLDSSYKEITGAISLKTDELKTVVVGIKTSRDNATITKVEIPGCVAEYSINKRDGKIDVWHSNGSKTNGHDIVMVVKFKGGKSTSDQVIDSGKIKIHIESLKTTSVWHPNDIPPLYGYFLPEEVTYETAVKELDVNVTDQFKQSQLDEVNNLEKYMEELVNELEKGPDSIPALISAAGSDNYKLALLFAALANFEDLHNEMINCARR